MKISIITVVYNGKAYLRECVESILDQSYPEIEYIVVDGGSTDGTLQILQDYQEVITHLVSGPDQGLYDALNKGIYLASGEVIGILNADDMLASKHIVASVAKIFEENPEVDGVYGDLNYIKPGSNQILRTWKSKQAAKREVARGWMPAHPTLYLKKKLFHAYGNYALDLGTAADYDLILRYFYVNGLRAIYLPMLMVDMRAGGVSNKNMQSLLGAIKNDYKALKRNGIPNAFAVLVRKKLSKIIQYW